MKPVESVPNDSFFAFLGLKVMWQQESYKKLASGILLHKSLYWMTSHVRL